MAEKDFRIAACGCDYRKLDPGCDAWGLLPKTRIRGDRNRLDLLDIDDAALASLAVIMPPDQTLYLARPDEPQSSFPVSRRTFPDPPIKFPDNVSKFPDPLSRESDKNRREDEAFSAASRPRDARNRKNSLYFP
jgi:hypothetical protein